jgi:hypothetical protein
MEVADGFVNLTTDSYMIPSVSEAERRRYRAPALEKGLDVLELLGAEPRREQGL